MKLVKQALPALLALGFMSTSWASIQVQCPDPETIKSSIVNNSMRHNGKFATTHFDNYGTPQMWGFGIVNIDGITFADALVQGNLALKSLAFKKGPVISDKMGVVACYYTTGAGYPAVALTVS